MDLAHLAELVGIAVASAALTILARRKPRALPPAGASPDATIPPVSLQRAPTGSHPAFVDVQHGTPRMRVLVVDDEPSFARLVKRLLTHPEHKLEIDVDLAHSAEQALELTSRHVYQVILLDLTLPGMNGRVLLPRLRARSIVYSGATDDVLDEIRRDGVADLVLAKDSGEQELIAAVRALLPPAPPPPAAPGP